MTLQQLVVVLVHCALEGGSARVNTYGLPPEQLLAFHFWRTTWPPTRRVFWREAVVVN